MEYIVTQKDLVSPVIGAATKSSPYKDSNLTFVSDKNRVAYTVEYLEDTQKIPAAALSFELAGPREKIYFDPKDTKAAIVTCGGISPGINAVIRSLVKELSSYGTKEILGIRYGYQGLTAQGKPPIELNEKVVDEIHLQGGSILGSSRGAIDLNEGINFLRQHQISILFCVGGDGTLRGALALSDAAKAQGYKVSIIGIPKTIDNDVPFVFQSFGFSTAVEKAKEIIIQAHTEVASYRRSLAIVKLMGREAGFITMHACLAAQFADIALIPEVSSLVHPKKFFSRIEEILQKKDSCLVVVAEGAGQDLFDNMKSNEADLSGNKKLNDIGIRLVEECKKYFEASMAVTIKYFDPSYSIRAVPANVADSMLCDGLARAAVHAAYAGKTEIIIGLWYNNLTHVPIKTVCKFRKRVNPGSATWQRLESILS